MNAPEAIAAIEGWIRQIEDLITTDASREFLCAQMVGAIYSGSLAMGDAVKAALNGDTYLDRALRRIAKEAVLAGDPLPQSLREFIAAALFMEAPPSFPKSTEFNSYNRDAAIRVLVERAVQEFGVYKYRNVATDRERHSACSLVAEALTNMGIKLEEKRVAEIASALN